MKKGNRQFTNLYAESENNNPVADVPIIVDLTDEKVHEAPSIIQPDTVEIWIPDDEEPQEIAIMESSVMHTLKVIDNNSSTIQNSHSHILVSNLAFMIM